MKKHMPHNEGTRNGRRKRKVVVANKRNFRRTIGIIVVVVMLLAIVQTGVLAAGGLDTSGAEVVIQSVDEPVVETNQGEDLPIPEPPVEEPELDKPVVEDPVEGNNGGNNGEVEDPGEKEEGVVPPEAPNTGDPVTPELSNTGDPVVPEAPNTGDPVVPPAPVNVNIYIAGATNPEIVEQSVLAAELEKLEAGFAVDGLEFGGWYMDAAFTEGNIFKIGETAVTAGMNLYAKLTAKSEAKDFTVTLMLNGAPFGSPIHALEENGYKIMTPASPTDADLDVGQKFEGWFYEETCENEFNPNNAIESNINLYAKITEKKLTVEFLDAQGNVYTTQQISVGGKAEMVDGTKLVGKDGAQFEHWTDADDPTEAAFDFGKEINENITLKPVFVGIVNVFFYTEANPIDPVQVKKGESISAPANPVREGYDFKGWSEQSAGDPRPIFDFNTKIEKNTNLYAVWEGKDVNVSIVRWTEKANIVGEPVWPNDYVTYDQISATAKAGTEITDVSGKLGDNNKITFFEYNKTIPTTVSGTGMSVVNVAYNRIVYTQMFQLYSVRDADKQGPNDYMQAVWPDGSNGVYKKDYNKTVYSFKAKYEQDISKMWPAVGYNTELKAFTDKGCNNLADWQYDGWFGHGMYGGQSTMITKRYTLAPDLIPTEGKIQVWAVQYRDSEWKIDANYWMETLEGQTGQPAKNRDIPGSFVKDESLSQSFVQSANSSLNAKDLAGFSKLGFWQGGNKNNYGTYSEYDFYYKRNRTDIVFNYNNGKSATTVNSVKHGQDILRYKPAADPENGNATFMGWYYDSNFLKKVDWEKDIVTAIAVSNSVPKVQLYAKWQNGNNAVNFYDKQDNIGSTGFVIAAYRVEDNKFVPGDVITINVDGKDYAMENGVDVPGYGKFNGWYYVFGGRNVPFSFEMNINKNYDIFAMWVTQGYALTYNRGEATTGDVPVDSRKYNMGVGATVLGNGGNLAVEGKYFIGWTDPNGKLYYPGASIKINGDTTLTAYFANQSESAFAVYKGGFEGAPADKTIARVKLGSTITLLPANTFTRANHEFTGWLGSDGKVYAAGDKVTLTKDNTGQDGSITFEAQWKATNHTIKFVPGDNGSLNGTTEFSVIPNTHWGQAGITVPTPVPNSGYFFKGWEPVIPSDDSVVSGDATYTAVFEKLRSIELVSVSATKVYDGTPLTKADVTAETKAKLGPGDTIEVTMTADSTITNVGSVPNKIASAKVYRMVNGVKTDVTNEYNFGGFIERTYGTLTVTFANVDIYVSDATKVYGDNDSTAIVQGTATETLSGVSQTVTANWEVVDGKQYAALEFTADKSQNRHFFGEIKITRSDIGENVGRYPFKDAVSIYSTNHKTPNKQCGSLEITKRPATVSAPKELKLEYGNNLSTPIAASVSNEAPDGFDKVKYSLQINGVDVDKVDYAKLAPGEYTITVVPGENPNYVVTPENGKLIVSKTAAAVRIVVAGNEITYGQDEPTPKATVYVNNQEKTEAEYTAMGISFGVTREQPTNKNVGEYKYVVENLLTANFAGEPQLDEGNLNIKRKDITLAAIVNGKVFGAAEPELKAEVTTENGLVGADKLVYTVSRDTSKQNVGVHKDNIYVEYKDEGVNKNYNITPVAADFTISKNMQQTIVLTPDASGKTYGDSDPAFTMNGITLPQGITLEAGTDYTISRNIVEGNGQFDSVGEYKTSVELTQSGEAKLGNYSYKLEEGVFNITPREATVTLKQLQKTYGDPDPNGLTVAEGIDGLARDTDNLSYTVSREPGESVKAGGYKIYGVAGDNKNYTIKFVEGSLTVDTRTITVTPKSVEKTYGEADPGFKSMATVDMGGMPEVLPGGATPDEPKFDVGRESGEDAGSYAISVTDSGNTNYTIVQGPAVEAPELKINPKPITITAPTASITVGEAIPSLAELINLATINPGLAFDEASLKDYDLVYKETPDNTKVGEVEIQVAINHENNKNYKIEVVSGKLVIQPISVGGTIDVDNAFKTYGEADPESFGARASESVTANNVVFNLVREPGETVGTYKINVVFPEGANPNFDTSKIVVQPATFTINKRPLTMAVAEAKKVYSDNDPEYTVIANGLTDTDKGLLSATVNRPDKGKFAEGGEDVGFHDLTLNVVENEISKNYEITNAGGKLEITPKPVTIKADDKAMVYGTTPEPALTATSTGIVNGDEIKVSLVRAAGSNVGNYPISVTVDTTSKAYKNYTVTTEGGNFAITPKEISVRVNDATKIYGNADPAFWGTPEGMLNGDVVNIKFTRVPGEDVGTYRIIGEALDANSNYKVTNIVPGTLTITKRPITVSPIGNGKVYGEADPTIGSSISGGTGPVAPSYSVSRQPGENVGTYAVNITLIGANSNYTIATGSANFVISQRPITVTADSKIKTYGDADPTLTAAVTGGSVVGTDVLDYTISRDPGEDVGSYPIKVAAGSNPNYDVSVVDGSLTIVPRDVDVVITPDNASKIYGSIDPTLTATVTGTVNNEPLNYTLVREAGENAGSYKISVELGDNPNYKIFAGEGVFSVTPKTASVAANSFSKTVGQADPQLTAVEKGAIKGDKLNYTISREAGEDAGVYAINVTLGSNPNYKVTAAAGALTISEQPLPPVPPVGPGTTEDPTTPDTPVTPVTPTPAAPETPPTPAPTAPVAPANTPQTVPLAGNTTPLADANGDGTVDLANNAVPLASNWSSWALLNLIFTILTAILSAIMLITYFVGKKKQNEEGEAEVKVSEYEEEEETTIKRKGFIRLLSVLVAVAAIIIFLVTEDITRPMVLTDRWTAFMGVIAIVQVVVMFFSKKSTRDNDSDNESMRKEDIEVHNV